MMTSSEIPNLRFVQVRDPYGPRFSHGEPEVIAFSRNSWLEFEGLHAAVNQ